MYVKPIPNDQRPRGNPDNRITGKIYFEKNQSKIAIPKHYIPRN